MQVDKCSSYKALYKVTPTIHKINDFKLPFPIPIDTLIIWVFLFIGLLAFFGITHFKSFLFLDQPIAIMFWPLVGAWAITKFDPSGKSLIQFLMDIFTYLINPKTIINWRLTNFKETTASLKWPIKIILKSRRTDTNKVFVIGR